jgi:hypothetical protein
MVRVCAACVRTPIFTILFVPHALFLHLDTTLPLVGSRVQAWRLGVCICRSFIHLVQSLNTFSVCNFLTVQDFLLYTMFFSVF